MSTWAYGTVARFREEHGSSHEARWPPWVDAVLAVVPAEARLPKR